MKKATPIINMTSLFLTFLIVILHSQIFASEVSYEFPIPTSSEGFITSLSLNADKRVVLEGERIKITAQQCSNCYYYCKTNGGTLERTLGIPDIPYERYWTAPQVTGYTLYSVFCNVTDTLGRKAEGAIQIVVLPRKLYALHSYSEEGSIKVAFDRNLNNATLNNSNITLNGTISGAIQSTFSFDVNKNILSITPNRSFYSGETVTVTIGTGLKDIYGYSLSAPYTTQFTVSSTSPEIETYSVTVNPSGSVSSGSVIQITANRGGFNCLWNGSVKSGVCEISNINKYDTIVLYATVPSGTNFDWGNRCDVKTTNTCTINSIQSNMILNPVSSVISYQIRVYGSGVNGGTIKSGSIINATWDGNVTSGDTSETVIYGSGPYTIEARANTGITVDFAGDCAQVTGRGTQTATCVINAPVTSNKNITAIFSTQKQYSLIVTKTGTGNGKITSSTGGINCGTVCSTIFASTTSVTLTAVASTGSVFAGWIGGGCSGTGVCIVDVQNLTSVIAIFNNTSDPPYTIHQTEQTKCYNESGIEISCAGTGQDGDLQAGFNYSSLYPYRSRDGFTNYYGDYTAYANYIYGFEWLTSYLFNSACTNGFTDSEEDAIWELYHCANYKCGNASWRIPNIKELLTYINIHKSTHNRLYFTATTNKDRVSDIITVEGNQMVTMSKANKVYNAIFVRDKNHWGDAFIKTSNINANPPSPRFLINSDETVTDNLTGLIWTKNSQSPGPVDCNPYIKTWQESLDYIKCLNAYYYLGYSDWRLPNYMELLSLVDYNQKGSFALPTGHPFSINPNSARWTSTTIEPFPSQALYIRFDNGHLKKDEKNIPKFVWPVRGGIVSQFNLTISKNGSGDGLITSSQAEINCGSTCSYSFKSGTSVTLTATPDGNSTFSGWTGGGCSGTGTCTVTINSISNVVATFNQKTYTLKVIKSGTGTGTVTSSPSGISCGTDCIESSSSYKSGTVVTITATPSSDSVFDNMYGRGLCLDKNPCVITMNSDITLSAIFYKKCIYTISPLNQPFASLGGTGNISVTASTIDCNGSWSAVSNVNWITITSGSSGTGNGTVNYFVSANTGTSSRTGTITIAGQTHTVIQSGVSQYTLTVTKSGNGSGTVTSSPSGINCGSTCSASFNNNATVTLTATADTNSTFNGWSGCDSTGGSTCTVVMNASKSITATFNRSSGQNIHPADTDGNSSISTGECVAYAMAWKLGQQWSIGPNPVPMEYAINACLIWKQGETYRYDPGVTPPWVSAR